MTTQSTKYFPPNKKQIALLIDPDKQTIPDLITRVSLAADYGIDLILVGGSLLHEPIQASVQAIKATVKLPVILFPGSNMQIATEADGILFLSLVSGRNPDLLIGQHVQAAPLLHRSTLDILPTGYLLIDGGRPSSVSYISHTLPIPAHKPDIATATALAAKFLGMQLIYLEAGSGALHPVSPTIIQSVSQQTGLPTLVGGGIRNKQTAIEAYRAGAHTLVIGTAAEQNTQQLQDICKAKQEWNLINENH